MPDTEKGTFIRGR
jgi:hypothetical protein